MRDFNKFEANYKRYPITLCGNQKCWYQCSNPDEEYYYAKVFDYLGKCPEFNYIPDLIAYLLYEYIKLVDLDSHTCRWPIGDPRDDDFCFCGKKVKAGKTYCDDHSAMAYVKATKR